MIYFFDGNFEKDRSSTVHKPNRLIARENSSSRADSRNVAPSKLMTKLQRMQAELAKRGLMGRDKSHPTPRKASA